MFGRLNQMFDFLGDLDNYENRKVARDKINGIEISTVYTSDEGYETALIDNNGTHVVERYETKELSEIGHNKWIEFAKNGNGKYIRTLGWLGFDIGKDIVLESIK